MLGRLIVLVRVIVRLLLVRRTTEEEQQHGARKRQEGHDTEQRYMRLVRHLTDFRFSLFDLRWNGCRHLAMIGHRMAPTTMTTPPSMTRAYPRTNPPWVRRKISLSTPVM